MAFFLGLTPSGYRYVGKEAAQEIYEQGVCLEEYLENLPEDGVSWAESD